MSHQPGAARFSNGDVYFFEYDGASGIAFERLFKSEEEAQSGWRTGRNRGQCQCQVSLQEPVELMTTYGNGSFWPGLACRQCLVITDGFDSFDAGETAANRIGLRGNIG